MPANHCRRQRTATSVTRATGPAHRSEGSSEDWQSSVCQRHCGCAQRAGSASRWLCRSPPLVPHRRPSTLDRHKSPTTLVRRRPDIRKASQSYTTPVWSVAAGEGPVGFETSLEKHDTGSAGEQSDSSRPGLFADHASFRNSDRMLTLVPWFSQGVVFEQRYVGSVNSNNNYPTMVRNYS